MKKIFEIPIYAFDKDTLEKRVEKSRKKFAEQYSWLNDKSIDQAWKRHVFPKNNWEYNHIVGVIKIYKKNVDIYIELFLADGNRFRWNSSKKVFMKNQLLNGTHFGISNLDNKAIRERVDELLHSILVHNIENKNYYVDLDVYDNVKDMIDYLNI